ncbi:MAG: glycosyltransferase [Verrucomicrobiota bacterium]
MAADRFSILIPSWNNLPFLKLCVEAIREHSATEHEVIIHLNEGADGSLEWVEQENLPYTMTPKNEGVCVALNKASTLAGTDFICYVNDDMYVLPGWDEALSAVVDDLDHSEWFLSGTMIEPTVSRNACVIAPRDYGRTPESFRRSELLREFLEQPKADWSGANWPPNLVSRALWNRVGGYSEEFSPGISSDPDFSRKLWEAGVRHFQGVGGSRAYHFQSASTGRVERNDGRRQFLRKWGMTQSTFTRCYLRLGTPWTGPLSPQPYSPRMIFYRLKSAFRLAFSR